MNTHNLSDAQAKYVRNILNQTQELDRNLRAFLNYVLEEAKLPAVEGGYSLSPDGLVLVPSAAPPKDAAPINTTDSTTR
jgi:hypothetical protein